MYVDRLAVLPIRLLWALESSFTYVGCAARASAGVLAATRTHLLREAASPPPPPTDGVADVIVLPRERKRER